MLFFVAKMRVCSQVLFDSCEIDVCSLTDGMLNVCLSDVFSESEILRIYEHFHGRSRGIAIIRSVLALGATGSKFIYIFMLCIG